MRYAAWASRILQAAVAAPEPPRPGIGGTPSAISIDGLYAGAICYGPAASEPPRCFRARGTIERGRIAARWSGRGSRVTMFMAGEISPTGDAKIRIDAGQPNGTRAAAIEMSGSLQAGRFDAAGAFRNGRTATLSWSKQDRAR
jgi:hypothetical protein